MKNKEKMVRWVKDAIRNLFEILWTNKLVKFKMEFF